MLHDRRQLVLGGQGLGGSVRLDLRPGSAAVRDVPFLPAGVRRSAGLQRRAGRGRAAARPAGPSPSRQRAAGRFPGPVETCRAEEQDRPADLAARDGRARGRATSDRCVTATVHFQALAAAVAADVAAGQSRALRRGIAQSSGNSSRAGRHAAVRGLRGLRRGRGRCGPIFSLPRWTVRGRRCRSAPTSIWSIPSPAPPGSTATRRPTRKRSWTARRGCWSAATTRRRGRRPSAG